MSSILAARNSCPAPFYKTENVSVIKLNQFIRVYTTKLSLQQKYKIFTALQDGSVCNKIQDLCFCFFLLLESYTKKLDVCTADDKDIRER